MTKNPYFHPTKPNFKMAKHLETGVLGEAAAVQYLRDAGYEILETNWRHSRAELDIIAKEGETLIFVEVKTRRSDFSPPQASVTLKKQKLLTRAARGYMEMVNHNWLFRFDVFAIHLVNENDIRIEHLKDAFFPGLS